MRPCGGGDPRKRGESGRPGWARQASATRTGAGVPGQGPYHAPTRAQPLAGEQRLFAGAAVRRRRPLGGPKPRLGRGWPGAQRRRSGPASAEFARPRLFKLSLSPACTGSCRPARSPACAWPTVSVGDPVRPPGPVVVIVPRGLLPPPARTRRPAASLAARLPAPVRPSRRSARPDRGPRRPEPVSHSRRARHCQRVNGGRKQMSGSEDWQSESRAQGPGRE